MERLNLRDVEYTPVRPTVRPSYITPYYPVIDVKQTAHICDAREKGNTVVAAALTEDEFDFLINGDDAVNENYTTQLAEEMLIRSTGLYVDLSTECAARTTLMADAEGADLRKNNNCRYLISKLKTRRRMFTKDDPDIHTVSIITPEDANVAIRSLNQSGGRPMAHRLEGMYIDRTIDLVWKTFENQIKTCQFFVHFKGMIDGLVWCINTEWDIDYADEVIRRVSMVQSGDIDLFIASGGRPSPQVYISANITSNYVFSQRPTISAESLGVASIFFQRYDSLCTMIAAITDSYIGPQDLNTYSFVVNPTSFSAFDSEATSGIKFPIDDSINSRNNYSAIFKNWRSFDDLIVAKQSLRVVERNESLKHIGVARMMAIGMGVAYQNYVMSDDVARNILSEETISDKRKSDVLGVSVRKSKTIRDVPEVNPSGMMTIMWGMFHKGDRSCLFEHYTAASAIFGMYAVLTIPAIEMSQLHSTMMNIMSYNDIMKAVNVASLRAIPGMKSVVELHSRSGAFLGMSVRWIQHVKDTVSEVISSMKDVYGTLRGGGRLSSDDTIWVGSEPRYMKAFTYALRAHAPWKFRSNIHGTLIEVASLGTGLDAPVMQDFGKIERLKKWYNDKLSDRSSETCRKNGLGNTVFSRARVTWAAHYDRKSKLYVNIIVKFLRFVPRVDVSGLYTSEYRTKGNCKHDLSGTAFMYHALIVEAIIASATSFCYMLAKMRLMGVLRSAYANMSRGKSYKAYMFWLLDNTEMHCRENIDVSLDTDKMLTEKNSAAYLASAERKEKLLKALKITEPNMTAWVIRVFDMSIRHSISVVRRTAKEMVGRDWHMMRRWGIDKMMFTLSPAELRANAQLVDKVTPTDLASENFSSSIHDSSSSVAHDMTTSTPLAAPVDIDFASLFGSIAPQKTELESAVDDTAYKLEGIRSVFKGTDLNKYLTKAIRDVKASKNATLIKQILNHIIDVVDPEISEMEEDDNVDEASESISLLMELLSNLEKPEVAIFGR